MTWEIRRDHFGGMAVMPPALDNDFVWRLPYMNRQI
jgi:hypothetical protein